jgi:alkylation response protein AidB-like acyl-CoA dehydrogenase
MSTTTTRLPKGAEWLVTPTDPSTCFTPEEFLEEQIMVKDMCAEFIEAEILPLMDRIDKLEAGLMPKLMDKAGELGLLGTVTPESLGGLGKDFITGTLINEALGGAYSFSVAVAAHTGIGTLPILYFGTDEQKEKLIKWRSELRNGNEISD